MREYVHVYILPGNEVKDKRITFKYIVCIYCLPLSRSSLFSIPPLSLSLSFSPFPHMAALYQNTYKKVSTLARASLYCLQKSLLFLYNCSVELKWHPANVY